ncbi:MAG: S-layer homology domain-containing protein [Dialister sp.]|uniref:S-layer homology domain-containing protein n=1 Tax=Dialister sp. TaxID=1955814 RepID=UPI002E75E7AC|nr:S-layer homology domain-containing protein [Dialister sp.]MEE0292207.1 S-layer homology domain-containing protein [Dialister sp.]
MRHCLLKTTLAAFFAATAFTVSAANPFADVDTSSWAYQAVCQLSDQGVVDGYPDGTFKGDKNVSRYELAQIIARLMAKEGSLNDSQKAAVRKLSAEYAGELQSLGVRVTELEKKTGNLSTITEIRVQDVPRYDNVYKDNKSSHDELSLRVRINTMANVNDRSTVYSQLETTMGMNGSTPFNPNRQDWSSRESSDSDKTRNGYGDGDFHMNRLWATYHFGKKQDTSKLPFGPSKNLIGIGQFPVKMGVTGYTYDGQFKGAFISFGDYRQGGRFTIAHGRATDINYNYTGPMVRGMHDMSKLTTETIKSQLLNKLDASGLEYIPALSDDVKAAKAAIKAANTNKALQTTLSSIGAGLVQKANKMGQSTDIKTQVLSQKLSAIGQQVQGINIASQVTNGVGYYNLANDTYYPMGQDVMEDWGSDEDVPVTYASYIFKKPKQWEFHAYGMTANGPIGKICKAYGFAGAYYVTPMWHVQGEFVKNMRKLPLNNERPYSFNYGLHYGTADVLEARSFEVGLDYVYSQAGTYFGGSSDDIVDQYMGHVYKNWHGMKNVPAYIADKMDAQLNGTDSANRNYGGAKFFLAKASFVPMRGLIIDAEYGFNAKDMGGRKMDNMFMLKATAYLK